METPLEERVWGPLNHLLCRGSPLDGGFTPDSPFSPSSSSSPSSLSSSLASSLSLSRAPVHSLLTSQRILVVGAGGLGCELLKDLSLMGFRQIDVIDMDTIDLSNLNRQFLFRAGDIGKSKADVAAAFINGRVVGSNVRPHFGKIEDKDDEFYRQFRLVICGLDSIKARRWMNSKLVSLVTFLPNGDPDVTSIIPMVDGGTEGFKGHVRVIFPCITSCFECMLDLFPPQVTFPECTIANTPRIPEHCVEYVTRILWNREKPFGKESINGDNADHLLWIFHAAKERAASYQIEGVTMKLTKGVVKHIIPSVASTNAIVAAACATEAFKIVTECSTILDDYFMYIGGQAAYTHTYSIERKESCIVCGNRQSQLSFPKSKSLNDLIAHLQQHADYQFQKPSLRVERRSLYMFEPPSLEEGLRANLSKPLADLFDSGTQITICDPAIGNSFLLLTVDFEE